MSGLGDKNYITPAGFRRLADELNWLLTVERPRVVREVSDAAAEGDRSENAAYIYGKRRLREIDRRMGFLQRRVDNATVVDIKQVKKDRVFFGATVEVEDEAGETVSYRIVGVDEVDATAGKISWRSPVGHALLGKQLDDEVTVRWSAADRDMTRSLTVVDIRYEEVEETAWKPPPPAWRPPAEDDARATRAKESAPRAPAEKRRSTAGKARSKSPRKS